MKTEKEAAVLNKVLDLRKKGVEFIMNRSCEPSFSERNGFREQIEEPEVRVELVTCGRPRVLVFLSQKVSAQNIEDTFIRIEATLKKAEDIHTHRMNSPDFIESLEAAIAKG